MYLKDVGYISAKQPITSPNLAAEAIKHEMKDLDREELIVVNLEHRFYWWPFCCPFLDTESL